MIVKTDDQKLKIMVFYFLILIKKILKALQYIFFTFSLIEFSSTTYATRYSISVKKVYNYG